MAQTILHAQRAVAENARVEMEIARAAREQQKEEHSAALYAGMAKRRAEITRRIREQKLRPPT
jgi:hypothetical protein